MIDLCKIFIKKNQLTQKKKCLKRIEPFQPKISSNEQGMLNVLKAESFIVRIIMVCYSFIIQNLN